MSRRAFVRSAMVGTTSSSRSAARATCLASTEDEKKARATKRPDGRPRLPPDQYLLHADPPDGRHRRRPEPGRLSPPGPRRGRAAVHDRLRGAPQDAAGRADVRRPLRDEVDGARRASGPACALADLAARAKPKPSARHVIFEAHAGYTANVPLREALAPNVLIAHKYEGQPLARAHGAPVRALVPDLYFWKSAKWLTGIRFVATRQARLLGDARLPQPRRSVERRAVWLRPSAVAASRRRQEEAAPGAVASRDPSRRRLRRGRSHVRLRALRPRGEPHHRLERRRSELQDVLAHGRRRAASTGDDAGDRRRAPQAPRRSRRRRARSTARRPTSSTSSSTSARSTSTPRRARRRRRAEAALLPARRQLAAPQSRQEGVDLRRRRATPRRSCSSRRAASS